jgi:hypothetical protein
VSTATVCLQAILTCVPVWFANKEVQLFYWLIRNKKFFQWLIRNLPYNILVKRCIYEIFYSHPQTGTVQFFLGLKVGVIFSNNLLTVLSPVKVVHSKVSTTVVEQLRPCLDSFYSFKNLFSVVVFKSWFLKKLGMCVWIPVFYNCKSIFKRVIFLNNVGYLESSL